MMDKKQEIINEYLLGQSGYRVLEKKYGVSRSALNRWVMDFQGRQHSRSRMPKTIPLPLMKQGDTHENLPPEVAALQRELAQERLRNKLLTAIIDVAEQELKLPIRKKYGTKPLKK
jgi:transposase-like protein